MVGCARHFSEMKAIARRTESLSRSAAFWEPGLARRWSCMASVIMTGNVGEGAARNHPISDEVSGDRVVGRTAPCGVQRFDQGFVKACLFVRSQKPGDQEPAATRDQINVLDAEILVDLLVEADPERVEGPFGDMAAMADAPHAQLRRGDHNLLARPRSAEIDLEGPPDHQHVEAEEAEHRPRPYHQEDHAGDEADHTQEQHHGKEAGTVKRAMRRQPRGEDLDLALALNFVACAHRPSVYP